MAAALRPYHIDYPIPPSCSPLWQYTGDIFVLGAGYSIDRDTIISCDKIFVLSQLNAVLSVKAHEIHVPKEYYPLWAKNLRVLSGNLLVSPLEVLQKKIEVIEKETKPKQEL